MNNEDGINAGLRNAGRGFRALTFSLIPWALGIAAIAWLSFYLGVRKVRHELAQEARAAIYTGSTTRPKSKIKIDITHGDCLRVTRADVDGSTLVVDAQNDCHESIYDAAWHWQELSPNGTVVADGYENFRCPQPKFPGDKAECRMDIATDDGADTLRVWLVKY